MLARLLFALLLAVWPGVAWADEAPITPEQLYQRMVYDCLPADELHAELDATDGAVRFWFRDAEFRLSREPVAVQYNRPKYHTDEQDGYPLTLTVALPRRESLDSVVDDVAWRQDAALGVGCFFWAFYRGGMS